MAFGIPLISLFGIALASAQSFAFRDAAHYYYPLYQWTHRQWQEGRIPLWNPLENCGVPALASTTASVFYPGQLVFQLPLDYASSYKLYIVLHLALAGVAAAIFARALLSSSLCASTLAAIAYAFGGHVLFQHCNVIYLVGAAWLPLALAAAHQALAKRSFAWSALFGAVMSLMVLGGDPQTAYHAGLAAAIYACLLWRHNKRTQVMPASGQWLRSRPILLMIAAVTGGALAAVQILPALEWTRQSQRADHRSRHTLYSVAASMTSQDGVEGTPSSARGGIVDAIVGPGHLAGANSHTYQFSVAPWHWGELVWPNISGHVFPTNRRWIRAMPAEGRTWTPSVYMGLLPLVLAVVTFRMRRPNVQVRWLWWVTCLGALGSMGWYGLGWLLQEIQLLPADDSPIAAPVGGLYWLMNVVLPGYSYFRYPAKLWTLVACGISMLAAAGWDSFVAARPVWLHRWLAGAAIVSVVAWLATYFAWSWLARIAARVPADSLFGPFQTEAAASLLRQSLLHTAVVSALLACLLRLPQGRWTLAVGYAALLLTAGELAWAQRQLIPLAPLEKWQEPAEIGRLIGTNGPSVLPGSAPRAARAAHERWFPPQWSRTASDQRLHEVVRWDRATLFPKYHLLGTSPAAMVDVPGALISRDYAMWLRVARLHGQRRADGKLEPHPAALTAIGAEYAIVPDGFRYPRWSVVETNEAENVQLLRNPLPMARAWVVRDVEVLPPVSQLNMEELQERTQHVLFPSGEPRNFSRSAVVEGELTPAFGTNAAPAGELCRITLDEPDHVTLEVTLNSPGLVVLADLHYPGWTAEVETSGAGSKRVEVLRTNRIMRGVVVPEGSHRIVYRYRPMTFYTGASISAAAWLLLGIVLVITRRQ